MRQITKAYIILQKVDVDLSDEELNKAKSTAVYTNKGWVVVDKKGSAHWMHLVANVPPGSYSWVYDKAGGMIRVTMIEGVPMSVGKIDITEDNLSVINDLPGYQNSELKVGETIEIKNDLSNKPVVLASTRRSSTNGNYPNKFEEQFISKFIMKNMEIEYVMAEYRDSSSWVIFWDEHS